MPSNYFEFGFLEDLQIGDVFKFSPTIDSEIPSKFYSVYAKESGTIKINSTYGKSIDRKEFPITHYKEVMIFPERKRYAAK